ncbi:hypothetical protein [Rhodococcus sp. 14-2496-1d]|uniref:hypothetical protein n=1 Tax=Rhodococcus sp. 14-2496-1d TaxID=2023146 RepID=UPI0027952F8C|nr:hypothetical protein [Rhodococcus sp. 14-2496-1d]
MIGNTANISDEFDGCCRQSRPANEDCDTFWPAPKQSYTAHPGKPFSRNVE